MSKRGSLVIITIITLVVASVIALTFPRISKDIASGKISFKESVAEDIAQQINVLCAYSYDMEIDYYIDLSNFIVVFSQNSVTLHDAAVVSLDSTNKIVGNDPTSKSYSFVCSLNQNFILDKPIKIIFVKRDGKINVK